MEVIETTRPATEWSRGVRIDERCGFWWSCLTTAVTAFNDEQHDRAVELSHSLWRSVEGLHTEHPPPTPALHRRLDLLEKASKTMADVMGDPTAKIRLVSRLVDYHLRSFQTELVEELAMEVRHGD